MTPPMSLVDFYKVGHRSQYPEGTELVFSNLTPRSSRIPGVEKVVFFGLSYYLQRYLIEEWNDNFFDQPKDQVVKAYQRRITNAGVPVPVDHVEALYDLGYLPLHIMAVPEGTEVPIGVPMLVLWNTKPTFFWLTNYLETSLSASIWGMCTSATIARQYKQILTSAAKATGGDVGFVNWQGHDFSMRGMYGLEAAQMSGLSHLTSFNGTDTVAAIDFAEKYYQANSDNELIGGSVPASEHSVMCMGTMEGELETYRRFITELYPEGIVSIVSDTWDYWNVVTEIVPQLKNEILARNGKVVIRPDSGSPELIICGDPKAEPGTPEFKGSFEILWEIFGGTVNAAGYKELDPHIGLIYGDSITMDICRAIANGLIKKGFVPSMVYGIGSFTYNYVTRDTFGFAVKATYGEVNGEPRQIFKDPKTDNGGKKSAKGLVAVVKDNDGNLKLVQETDWDAVYHCEFEDRFVDGGLYNMPSLTEVRERIDASII